MLPIERSKDLI